MYFSGIPNGEERHVPWGRHVGLPGRTVHARRRAPAVWRRLHEHRPDAVRRPEDGQALAVLGFGQLADHGAGAAPEDRKGFAPGSRPKELIYPSGLQQYERLIEGAFVVYRDPYYYLFYSGDNCCALPANYAVMVARSRSATGPFEKRADATGEFGGSVILQMNDVGKEPATTPSSGTKRGRTGSSTTPSTRTTLQPRHRVTQTTDAHRSHRLPRRLAQIEGTSPSTTERQGPLVR